MRKILFTILLLFISDAAISEVVGMVELKVSGRQELEATVDEVWDSIEDSGNPYAW